MYPNLHFAVLSRLLLIADGDVETNPGPTFKIIKSVAGSFNQGDARFGTTAGSQCACNSLFSICWSVIRKVSVWKTLDLDTILIEGDRVYKLLNNLNDYLSVDDLPNRILHNNCQFNVDLLSLVTGEATPSTKQSILAKYLFCF